MDNEAIAFPLFSLLGLLALRALHCPRKAGMQLLHMNQVSLLLQAAFKALGHCAPEELASGEMSKVFNKIMSSANIPWVPSRVARLAPSFVELPRCAFPPLPLHLTHLTHLVVGFGAQTDG